MKHKLLELEYDKYIMTHLEVNHFEKLRLFIQNKCCYRKTIKATHYI